MAIATLCKRKNWCGLDADKAEISPSAGDTFFATDTLKSYYGNGASWKTGLGYEFVERLTNAPDKQVGDFTCDGNPHVDGLDLSGIVPVGAIAVKLQVKVLDDAANSFITIERDAVNTQNSIQAKIFVASISNIKTETISIDSNRLLDYTASNLVFVVIDVTVLGWYI